MDNYEQNNQNSESTPGYTQDAYTVAESMPLSAKKSKLPFILGGAGILAAAAAAICLLVPSVNNSIRMAFMKPENYLAHVEEINFDAYASEAGDMYQSILDLYDPQNPDVGMQYELSLEASDALKTLIAEEIGDEITLDSIGAAFAFNAKGKNFGGSGSVSLNNKLIANLDFALDEENIYLKIPQLSAAYIYQAISLDSFGFDSAVASEALTGLFSDKSGEAGITADQLESLIKKYSALIYENFDNVSLDKGVKGEINGISYEYNKLTVTMDVQNATKIATAVLNALKDDKIIKDFLVASNIVTADDYVKGIEDALKTVSEEGEDEDDDALVIELYVDGNGKIMGRNYKLLEDIADVSDDFFTINYISAESSKGFAGKFEFNADEVLCTVNIKPTGDKEVYSGDITVVDSSSSDAITMNATFEDIKTVNKEKGYISGKYTVSSKTIFNDVIPAGDLNLDVITCTFESDGTSQKAKITYGNIFDMNVDYSFGKAGEIKFPSDSDEKFNMDDPEDGDLYLSSIDTEALLTALSDALGMSREEMETLFSALFLGGYDDYDDDYYDDDWSDEDWYGEDWSDEDWYDEDYFGDLEGQGDYFDF